MFSSNHYVKIKPTKHLTVLRRNTLNFCMMKLKGKIYKAYKKKERPRFPETKSNSEVWPQKSMQDQWSTCMREAAAGVHTGLSAGTVTAGRLSLS